MKKKRQLQIRFLKEQNKEAAPTETNEAENEASVQQQDADQIPSRSRMGRPLWLVLLWSATLALIAAYVLYIYVLDPMLNPF